MLWGFALSTWIAWLRISLCCCSYRHHRISATFPIATQFCTACRGFRSFHLWKCSWLHVKDMPESFEGVMSRQRLSWSLHVSNAFGQCVLSRVKHTQRELNQVQTIILNGWPNVQQEVPAPLCSYWDSRSEQAVCYGII